MKKILLLVVASVFFTGCSGLIQTGSVSRAYESYEERDYKRTLELISFAQKVNTITPELNAELTFLKAKTYAKLGMHEKSENLYRNLAVHHKDTEYGYLAFKRMNDAKVTQ